MEYSIRIPGYFGSIDQQVLGVRAVLRSSGYDSTLTSGTENDDWRFKTSKTLDDRTADRLRQVTGHEPVELRLKAS